MPLLSIHRPLSLPLIFATQWSAYAQAPALASLNHLFVPQRPFRKRVTLRYRARPPACSRRIVLNRSYEYAHIHTLFVGFLTLTMHHIIIVFRHILVHNVYNRISISLFRFDFEIAPPSLSLCTALGYLVTGVVARSVRACP
ncbi:hypothetical protein FKP32DRAFT_816549 [Trametes sanguinea]|nr:hypothetical protein FKP32DRAFT_816549 [Trametes sanguinea]